MNDEVLSKLRNSMRKLDDKGNKFVKLVNTANIIYKKSEKNSKFYTNYLINDSFNNDDKHFSSKSDLNYILKMNI